MGAFNVADIKVQKPLFVWLGNCIFKARNPSLTIARISFQWLAERGSDSRLCAGWLAVGGPTKAKYRTTPKRAKKTHCRSDPGSLTGSSLLLMVRLLELASLQLLSGL